MTSCCYVKVVVVVVVAMRRFVASFVSSIVPSISSDHPTFCVSNTKVKQIKKGLPLFTLQMGLPKMNSCTAFLNTGEN